MKRDDLTAFMNHYLNSDAVSDYCPNGLQVEGAESIQLIATAVTASMEAIHFAIEKNADALLVHHGYFWKGEPLPLVGIKGQRIKALCQHNINLYAYHLPLDIHPIIGNNVLFGQLLSLQALASHSIGGISDLLWTGNLTSTVPIDALVADLATSFNTTPLWLQGGAPMIQSIAWCTGAAEGYIIEAKQLGADVFISGEVSERTYDLAKELGIHYVACGHVATERFGIVALGDKVAASFGVPVHHFVSNNPV
jgi:dinuclear metal center YbgI/SA1388 family protein